MIANGTSGTAEEDDWDRVPTALEAAHYDMLLRQAQSRDERMKAAEAERARRIFGDCLLKLIGLGMDETKARSMLGKWRGQAKDDERLVRVVTQAHEIGTPDPISYVTKALAAATQRAAKSVTRAKATWERLGWEKPRLTTKGPKWRGALRGEVWRDPFGKIKVLPPAEGTVPPGIEEDPGVEVEA